MVRLTHALLLVALAAGCRNAARDHDCAAIRRVLAVYDVGSGRGSAGIFDVGALHALEHRTFADPEVAAAVKDALATQWQVYTPHGSDHARAVDKLRALCR